MGLTLDPFFMEKALNFLKELREELDKVVWPTRDQTVRYTVLVIAVALVVGLVLGGLDYILTLFTDFLVKGYDR